MNNNCMMSDYRDRTNNFVSIIFPALYRSFIKVLKLIYLIVDIKFSFSIHKKRIYLFYSILKFDKNLMKTDKMGLNVE